MAQSQQWLKTRLSWGHSCQSEVAGNSEKSKVSTDLFSLDSQEASSDPKENALNFPLSQIQTVLNHLKSARVKLG